jgi:3-deoxy-D-manno-octulosonic-acid transferase
VRRSICSDIAKRKPCDNAVVLGDTMGELRKFYSLASVVFVGRSIAAMGGSDMMEVAALAKPILIGPHTENFADAVQQLQRRAAMQVVETEIEDERASEKLAEAVAGLLDRPEVASQLAANARKVVQENRGATERTLASLIEIAERQPSAGDDRSGRRAGTSRDVTWNTQ